jgi:copper chaperone CopZ
MFKSIFKLPWKRRAKALETRRIGIKGMTSKRCERTVKKALLTKSGVKEVYINREDGVATITFDPSQTDIPSLQQVILRKGYFPNPVEG